MTKSTFRLVVDVTQTDDGNPDRDRFAERLLVGRGVGDDQHLRLVVLLEVRVREAAGNEPLGERYGTEGLREDPHRLLPVLSLGHHQDPVRGKPGEELRGEPDPAVGLADVEDVEAVESDFEDEPTHRRRLLLGADVDAGSEIRVLGDQELAGLDVLAVARRDGLLGHRFFLGHGVSFRWRGRAAGVHLALPCARRPEFRI